jgi:hypothetical protein
MRVDALAAYLGQSTAWCRQALADGTLPGGRKVRGRWMVARADVDAWLDAGRPDRPEPDGVRYQPPPRTLSRTVDRDAA